MSSCPALTFCGTDTGVGKTFVARALIEALGREGVRVAPFKPLESGVGAAGPGDAIALRDAALQPPPLDVVCPWPLPRPVAPADELERLGQHVGRDQLLAAAEVAGAGADLLVVETAGGIKSPLTSAMTSLDLAAALGGAVVLIARDGLGVIGRASAAVDAATLGGVTIDLVVLNRLDDGDGPWAEDNARWLRALHPGLTVAFATSDVPCPDALRQLALRRLETSTVLG